MARIGYARVSTADQDLEQQFAKLKGEGCELVRSEKVSGASRDGRNELSTVLEFLRPGDELAASVAVETTRERISHDKMEFRSSRHSVMDTCRGISAKSNFRRSKQNFWWAPQRRPICYRRVAARGSWRGDSPNRY